MDRQQATVTEWVDLRPIFDFCVRDTGYEGERILWVPWWMQDSEENQLKVEVEAILEAARVRRRQESSRGDGSEGGSEGGSTDREE